MTLDTKLTYSEHIENLITKGERALHILRKIGGASWGVKCNTRLLLYKNYILPKTVYGEEFFDKGSLTSLNKLQKFQNKTLTIISNTRKSLPIAARHYLCQLPTLEIRRKIKILHLHNRLQYNQENPTNTIFTDRYDNTTHYRNKNKIKPTFVESTRTLIQENSLTQFKVNSMPKPIEYWALKLIEVDTSIVKLINEYNNPTVNDKLDIVLNHLRLKYANHYHIYCDGAKNRDTGHTGIGIYDITNNITYNAKLNTHLHIDNVELAAASFSAKYINQNMPNSNSLILSDSLSACRRLSEYSDTDPRLDLVNVIHRFAHNSKIRNGSITILWIPAHINLTGHDIADRLAKEGTHSRNFKDLGYSTKELKLVIESAFTIPTLQSYWQESRIGTHGRSIIPNFFSNLKINNLTKRNSISHLLIRLIFGTANFHIRRNNAACEECQSNLSIEHVVLHCKLFEHSRNRISEELNKLNKETTLENILSPNCHASIKELRNILIREIHDKFTI